MKVKIRKIEFVGSRVLPEPKMISSTRTKEAIETGVDDDISM